MLSEVTPVSIGLKSSLIPFWADADGAATAISNKPTAI
jgi:hypothetical protein